MIRFTCAKCGKIYEVENKYSGKSVKCKKCNNKLIIPKEPEKEQTKEYQILDEIYQGLPAPEDSNTQNLDPIYDLQKETKACPFCGEEILEVAKKCKHCGEFLEILNPIQQTKNNTKKKKIATKSRIPFLIGIIIFVVLLSGGVYLLFFTEIINSEKQNQSNQVLQPVDDSGVASNYMGEFENVVTKLRRLNDNITSGSVNYSEYKNLVSDYINSFSDLVEWLETNTVPYDLRVKDMLTNMKSALDHHNGATSNWGQGISNADSPYIMSQYEKTRDMLLDFALYEGQMTIASFKSLKKNEAIDDYRVLRKSMIQAYVDITEKYDKQVDKQVEAWNKANPNLTIE